MSVTRDKRHLIGNQCDIGSGRPNGVDSERVGDGQRATVSEQPHDDGIRRRSDSVERAGRDQILNLPDRQVGARSGFINEDVSASTHAQRRGGRRDDIGRCSDTGSGFEEDAVAADRAGSRRTSDGIVRSQMDISAVAFICCDVCLDVDRLCRVGSRIKRVKHDVSTARRRDDFRNNNAAVERPNINRPVGGVGNGSGDGRRSGKSCHHFTDRQVAACNGLANEDVASRCIPSRDSQCSDVRIDGCVTECRTDISPGDHCQAGGRNRNCRRCLSDVAAGSQLDLIRSGNVAV